MSTCALVQQCDRAYHASQAEPNWPPTARGGIPADEAGWQELEMDGDSPYIHVVDENEPTRFAYRPRYLGKTLKFGPFGNTVTCIVNV